mmetsp:Transcript_162897/g.522329  ORF Transcript_162897/g.522329 Transcript_162897/m.522329 type:complete len:86 (+) Transcript_162897:373-630(+)
MPPTSSRKTFRRARGIVAVAATWVCAQHHHMKHGLHEDPAGIKQQVAEGICENAVRDLSFQAIKLGRVAQAPMCRQPEDVEDGPQ